MKNVLLRDRTRVEVTEVTEENINGNIYTLCKSVFGEHYYFVEDDGFEGDVTELSVDNEESAIVKFQEEIKAYEKMKENY